MASESRDAQLALCACVGQEHEQLLVLYSKCKKQVLIERGLYHTPVACADCCRLVICQRRIILINLDYKAQKRYIAKLTVGEVDLPDPYSIPDDMWLDDTTKWPSLEFGEIYTSLLN